MFIIIIRMVRVQNTYILFFFGFVYVKQLETNMLNSHFENDVIVVAIDDDDGATNSATFGQFVIKFYLQIRKNF